MGGEVGSPMWVRICVMGSGSIRGRSEAETAVGGLVEVLLREATR